MEKKTSRQHLKPTKDDVSMFVNMMFANYRVPLVDKRSAPEMKLVASVLSTLGVMDTKTFLERYSTYLFGRVYLPFVPGTTSDPSAEIVVIAHEYGHAFQDQRSGKGLEFEIDYLDTRKRAVLEAECYALGACLSLRYRGAFVSAEVQVARAVEFFKTGYGSIPDAHLEVFQRELRRRVNQYAENQQPFNEHIALVTLLLDRVLIRTRG